MADEDIGWRKRPCRGLGRLFFFDEPDDIDRARPLCGSCGEAGDCLIGAVDRREACGVWGGKLIRRGVVLDQIPKRGRPTRVA